MLRWRIFFNSTTGPTIKDTEFDEVPEAIANYQPHIYKYSSQQEQRQAQQEVSVILKYRLHITIVATKTTTRKYSPRTLW